MHTSLNKLQNIATSCTVTTHKYASLTSENILSMDTIVSLKGIDGGGGFSCKKSPSPHSYKLVYALVITCYGLRSWSS